MNTLGNRSDSFQPKLWLGQKLLFLTLSIVPAACSHNRTPPVTRPHLRAQYPVYKIARGDTILKIAKRYQLDADKLVKLNEIRDPGRIFVGQELLIPMSKELFAGLRALEKKEEPVKKPAPKPKKPSEKPQNASREPPPPPPLMAPNHAPLPLDCKKHPQRSSEDKLSRKGFLWPVDGVIVARYGSLEGKKHNGLALAAPQGTPVFAGNQGEVVFAGTQSGYGNIVVVEHPDQTLSLYGRNAQLCVKEKQRVKRGQLIALVGKSGGASAPGLYFEVRVKNKPVNPKRYLPR